MNTPSIQIFAIFLTFWLHLEAYAILVPQPWIKPVSPAVEAQSLTSGPPREVPNIAFLIAFSIQFSSVPEPCPTLYDPRDCSTPIFPVHHQLPEFTQIHVHRVSDAIQPSHPLHPLLLPPSTLPSIRVFSNESVLHTRWPMYWSFSFSISPSNEYTGEMISFRMDWFDLLAVQGTLKSLLQHHNKKSINSSALIFLYSLTLTSIHDYWKNHSLD